MRKCWAVWAAVLCLVCAGCLFAPSEPTVADGSYTTGEAMSGSACEAAVAAFLAALDSGDATQSAARAYATTAQRFTSTDATLVVQLHHSRTTAQTVQSLAAYMSRQGIPSSRITLSNTPINGAGDTR